MLGLPDVALQHVCTFLQPPELLALLASCVETHVRLNLSPSFWTHQLSAVLGRDDKSRNDCAGAFASQNNSTAVDVDQEELLSLPPSPSRDDAKEAFLKVVYRRYLPSIRWLPLRRSLSFPSAREGHLCCRLGNRLIITGGFSDDRAVHIRNLANGNDWESQIPRNLTPGFAYGATLTPLDTNRALMFGGFGSGGYREETYLAYLLIIDEESGEARWERVQAKMEGSSGAGGGVGKITPADAAYLARAYHTATLIENRYLLVLGGMQTHNSVWNPVVLDTHAWTWRRLPSFANAALDTTRMTGNAPPLNQPSPRHGHSVICDAKRGRLVLFGGGNGSDLIRSGEDNAQVWQFSFPKSKNFCEIFNSSQQQEWTWNILHYDEQLRQQMPEVANLNEQHVTPAESLSLGRCHVAHLVSSETVVLVFGSGRPCSTNGLLAYNLASNTFFRPKISGPLPVPRFTCASTFIRESCSIFFHGGYSTQHGAEIDDMQLLDLAPALRREYRLPPSFAIDPHAEGSDPVNDQHLREEQGRGAGFPQRGQHFLGQFFQQVLLARGDGFGGGGAIRFAFDANFEEESSSNDDDDDDYDYMPTDEVGDEDED